jgi:hypothetical protein
MYRCTPLLPTKKILQLHQGLAEESARLIQLRTEKTGLKSFLFGRKVSGITSPRCECGGEGGDDGPSLTSSCCAGRTKTSRAGSLVTSRDDTTSRHDTQGTYLY